MVRDRENFFSFWSNFCPNKPENQNFEKMKRKKNTPRDTIAFILT